REPDLRVLHLPGARLVPELLADLVDHPDTGRADRMPERLEAPARVHGDGAAVDRRPPLRDVAPALTGATEAQILVVQDLRDREAVVDLRKVEIRGGDPRLLVGRSRRLARRRKAGVGESGLQIRLPGRHRETEALDPDRVGAKRARNVPRAYDRGRGTVGRRAAVEETERAADERRAEHLLLGHLHLEVRLR